MLGSSDQISGAGAGADLTNKSPLAPDLFYRTVTETLATEHATSEFKNNVLGSVLDDNSVSGLVYRGGTSSAFNLKYLTWIKNSKKKPGFDAQVCVRRNRLFTSCAEPILVKSLLANTFF